MYKPNWVQKLHTYRWYLPALLAVGVYFITFGLFASFVGCAWAESPEYLTNRELTASETAAVVNSVSLISLIANPTNFANRIITVKGYLHVEYEDERLYLSSGDAEHLIRENALEVDFASRNLLLELKTRAPLPKNRQAALRRFNKRYVLLIGRFEEGHLSQVSRIMEL